MEHLASLNLPLEGQRVLEVGAGVGMLTRFFEDRGCEVISTDGRQANVDENLRRHPWREGRVHVADLERPGSHEQFGEFDAVFCYGTLYHMADPGSVISELAKRCSRLFLLETRVNPIDNGRVNPVVDSTGRNESLRGLGCQPARDWIMAELRKHLGFVYLTMTQPNHPEFPTSWPAVSNKARSVFVASRAALRSPLLSEELLEVQSKC